MVRELVRPVSTYNSFFLRNIKEKWCGIEGIDYFERGVLGEAYALKYKDYVISADYVENVFWGRYNKEYPAPLYGNYVNNFAEFDKHKDYFYEVYLKEHSDEVIKLIEDVIDSYVKNLEKQ